MPFFGSNPFSGQGFGDFGNQQQRGNDQRNDNRQNSAMQEMNGQPNPGHDGFTNQQGFRNYQNQHHQFGMSQDRNSHPFQNQQQNDIMGQNNMLQGMGSGGNMDHQQSNARSSMRNPSAQGRDAFGVFSAKESNQQNTDASVVFDPMGNQRSQNQDQQTGRQRGMQQLDMTNNRNSNMDPWNLGSHDMQGHSEQKNKHQGGNQKDNHGGNMFNAGMQFNPWGNEVNNQQESGNNKPNGRRTMNDANIAASGPQSDVRSSPFDPFGVFKPKFV